MTAAGLAMPRSRSSGRLTGRSPASRSTRRTMSWRRWARSCGTRAIVAGRGGARAGRVRKCSCDGRRAGRQLGERRVELGLAELRVLERAREIRVVGGEIEVAVAAEAEQDDPLLPRLARGERLLDRR